MIGRIGSVALWGLEGRPIDVEVHIGNGLPGVQLVGLPDTSVRESHARVKAAMASSGLPWPTRRVVVNLSPGDVSKEGPCFDLPIALAMLVAAEHMPAQVLDGLTAVGELGLDGQVKPVRGVLSVTLEARSRGSRGVICPEGNAPEAALVDGITIHPATSLASLVAQLLEGGLPTWDQRAGPREVTTGEDLADVRGQHMGRRAIEVAAAGGHHLLLAGPPGAGKTMLARRLPGVLPPLTDEEALEITRIHSVAGLLEAGTMVTRRPFRAPHHTVSVAGLVGGGSRQLRPGEASMAHGGILFMDEMAAFSPQALSALREPLEDGRIRITRHRGWCTFPAHFLLVAATNPCPCGFRDDPVVVCRCGEAERSAYDRRLSGPLLDRFDLLAHLERPDPDLVLSEEPGAPSELVASRVSAARAEQAARLAPFGVATYGALRPSHLRQVFTATPAARADLSRAGRSIPLSGRGLDKVRRVALTLACLDGSSIVSEDHVLEALSLRGGPLLGEVAGALR